MSTHYLVYVSQADSHLGPKDLEAILAESLRYNPTKGITGILLYVEGKGGKRASFMQILEGGEAEIEKLRKRIFSDSRHHTKIVLERGQKETRDFPDWSMAFKTVAHSDLTEHPVLAAVGDADFQIRCARDGLDGALSYLCDFWNEAA